MRSRLVSAASVIALAVAACGEPGPFGYRFVAAGTEVSITVYSTSAAKADAAIRDVETQLLKRSIDWYPWADGELRALNAAIARGDAFTGSEALRRLVDRAAGIERRSGGRFNAGLGAVSELWGFHRPDAPPQRVPSQADMAAILDTMPGLATFDRSAAGSVPASTVIDLGGIAKGAMLEEAAAILADNGIDGAIVNLGGDLLVIGSPPGRDARIGVRSPFETSVAFGFDVAAGEAVMSSGNYERFFDIDGRRYHHILDPATGFPVTHTAAVTVVHEDPVLADAAATALLVGGPDAFDALCAALDIDHAVLFSADGDTVLTPAMRERLD
jgi:thiamine biosynthesis lipoprotein